MVLIISPNVNIRLTYTKECIFAINSTIRDNYHNHLNAFHYNIYITENSKTLN